LAGKKKLKEGRRASAQRKGPFAQGKRSLRKEKKRK